MPAPPRRGWGFAPGAGAVTGCAGAAVPPLATVASTSAFVMRPAGPDPVTLARSIPSAAAIRAATGETFASEGTGVGARVVALLPSAGSSAAGAGAGVVAEAPFVAVVIRAMTWATVIVSPSPTRTSMIVPAEGAGSSTSTLSVEISAIAWPSSTASPAATCHSTSVPSETDSPAGVAGRDVPLDERALGDRLAGGRGDDVDRLAGCGVIAVGLGFGRRRAVAGGVLRVRPRGAPVARRGGRSAGGRSSVSRRDLGEDRAHLDGVALRGVDLGDRPAGGGRDLRVDLVGRDLDDDLVGLDAIALLLVPFQDGPLGHGLAHLGERDLHCRVDRHICSI